MKTTPHRLSIEEFGCELLRSLDLDPVYVMLYHARLTPEQLAKWLLAYWCYYHSGVASFLSEFSNSEYWGMMWEVAANTGDPRRYPRGKERRHFRGQQADRGVEHLKSLFPKPEQVLTELTNRPSFVEMNKYVQSWKQFGPWIAFKVCDMAQAVLGIPLTFEGASLAVYDEPVKGAQLACSIWYPNREWNNKQECVDMAVERLLQEFKHHKFRFKAPPRFERELNIMEIETVLCKWKSHMGGHYPVHHDLNEILSEDFRPWGDTAVKMQEILRKAAGQ
jgi:hypothetical protein